MFTDLYAIVLTSEKESGVAQIFGRLFRTMVPNIKCLNSAEIVTDRGILWRIPLTYVLSLQRMSQAFQSYNCNKHIESKRCHKTNFKPKRKFM
jgi:hypothetical protein